MKQIWTINLSTEREIRDHYIKEGKFEIAESIKNTSSKYEGKAIDLLTLEDLKELMEKNPETVLISIFGEEILAKNANEDTRMGYVAFGRLVS